MWTELRRLHRRWRHLAERRGPRLTIVTTAIARERAGHLWELAMMERQGPDITA